MLPIEGGIHKALQVIHANGAGARLHVVSGQSKKVYVGAGDTISLPCRSSSCSSVNWFHGQRRRISEIEVKGDPTLIISPVSQRLKDDCSLPIAPVTEEDAGLYICEQDGHWRTNIELSVMTVKLLSPLDSDLMRDQNMVLECSLLWFCSDGILRWIDERGNTLCISRDPCVSRLKVLPVSRVSNYTCQFVMGEMVEAQYTAVFTKVDAGGPEGTQPPPDPKMLLINIIRIGVSLLILFVILVVVILVKRKSSRDAGQDRQS